jgi:hypothetical protein
MPVNLESLIRMVSQRCDEVVAGVATGGSATTLVDSRLSSPFPDDDTFNGAKLVLNEGGGNMVFVSDCESVPPGDFTAATVTSDTCKVYRSRTWKKTGKWSYQFTTGTTAADQAYVSATHATTYTTLYSQAHIYIDTAFTGAAIVSLQLIGLGLYAYNHNTSTASALLATLAADTAYRIEMAVGISATVGTIDVWVDEGPIYSVRAANTGSTAIGKTAFGLLGTAVAEAKTIYMDDIRVDQTYIGTRSPETEKTISDYTGATGTITWVGNIVAPTASYTRYSIYDWPKTRWSRQQKKDAINQAILMLWPYWYKRSVSPVLDNGVGAVITTRYLYAYALPANCERVLNVFLQNISSLQPYTREVNFSVDGSSGSRYLRLPNANSYLSGYNVRIEYMARATELENTNDELQIDEAYLGYAKEFVICKALSILWESTGSPGDVELPMSQSFERRALLLVQKHTMPVPASVIQVETNSEAIPWSDRIRHGFSWE